MPNRMERLIGRGTKKKNYEFKITKMANYN